MKDKKQILFLLTVTNWDDRRQHLRQAPALLNSGYEIIYMSGKPKNEDFSFDFKDKPLNEKEIKRARYTGSLNLYRKIVKISPDIVQLSSVEHLPLGILLSLVTDIKVVYDCRENMFYSMKHSKVWIPKPVRFILAYCTKLIESIADLTLDGAVFADPGTASYHHMMDDYKKMVFYNTAQLSLFKDSSEKVSSKQFDLVWLGGMSIRSGFDVFIEMLQNFKSYDRPLNILLVGDLEEKEQGILDNYLNRENFHNVTITGIIPHEDVPNYLEKAKVGLVLLNDYPKYHFNIACKAFEYMAVGLPTVSSDLEPQRQFLEEDKSALFFPPGNAEDASKQVFQLLADEDKIEEMGKYARSEVEKKWNCEKEQKKYVEFYNRIAKVS